MIVLVGVGHVFDLNRQIRSVILDRRPSVVAIELDEPRFRVLVATRQGKDLRKDMNMPLLYALLAKFQDRIAKKYGITAGDEMLAAADGAKEIGAHLALIDTGAQGNIMNLWKALSFKEKSMFIYGVVASAFVTKKRVEKEIDKLTNEGGDGVIDSAFEQMPTIKKVMLDDRNANMARNISGLHDKYGDVMAFIGDAHVPGIKELLGEAPVEEIRLRTLQDYTIKENAAEEPEGNSSLNMSFEV